MTEQTFIDALCECPGDQATINAFTDWLMEHGRETPGFLKRLDPRPEFEAMAGSIVADVREVGDELHFTTILGEKFKMWYAPD